MWRRWFGIPPPFRGVTAGNDGIEPPAERPPSYQLERHPTKSLTPPTLEPAPWSAQTTRVIASDETGRLGFPGLARANRPLPLGPFSPLFENEEVRQLSAPRVVDQTLGFLSQNAAAWQLKKSVHTLVNGRALPPEVALADGDVVEARSPRGPWHAWVVRFEEGTRGETGLGPLWRPFRIGAFTLEPADVGRWRGVLRAGTFEPALDSLEWLRRILKSDFAGHLDSLEIHLAQHEGAAPWDALVAAHLQLASGAPFTLTLRGPRFVEEAAALAPVMHRGEPGPDTSTYGVGTRWTNRSPSWFLNGAPEALVGWTTLAVGDCVEHRGVASWTFARGPVPPRSHTPTGPVPWVLFPAQRKHFPLERSGDGWALKLAEKCFQFSEVSDGLALEQAALSVEQRTDWFTPLRLDGVSCILLPGRSAFLAGETPLRAESGLTPQAVARFASELEQRGDVAAGGLLEIAAGAPTASTWLNRLLTPFGKVSEFDGSIAHEDAEHCCGFFTTLRVAPWMDFERDLPVLLEHPLMSQLRRLELFPRPNMLRPPQLETLRAQARSLRPDLEIVLPVLPFGRARR